MNKLALLFASTAIAAAPAAATTAEADQPLPPGERAPGSDHVHQQAPAEIIVTAPFVRQLDVLAGTAVLTGTALLRDLQPQIGDTLTRLPGVSATSFGPGASRPVLRGFQGERVRVMIDGLGSIDASSTSADHAVTIDPITTDRIEVLHGPAVLLFGSQAIGGAVNAFDRRIPRALPDGHFHLDAIGVYGSAANERSIGGGVDFQLGNAPVVFHIDGSWRRTDDLRIGGFVHSPALRAELLEIAEEEEEEGHLEEAAEAREFAGLRGRLPNSFTRQKTAGAGVALIQDRGSLGFSVSYFGSRYGVPERPFAGHGHHDDHDDDHHDDDHDDDHGGHHEGPVSIDLQQIRADLRGELITGGAFIDRLRLRLGAADYEHTEFEGDEVGTVFRVKGMEGRAELVQAERGGWRGVTGGQFFVRDFAAVGAEAFVPPNSTSQLGLFTLQEVNFGSFEIEGAARYEHSNVRSRDAGFDRNFGAVSAAIGASYEFSPFVRAGLNLSRAERAPAAEELLSDGPHIATQAFEIGDPTLGKERSLGAELFLRAQTPHYRVTASLFANRFENFIFQAATGEEEDELPVFQYMQRDATHWGFELGASSHVWRTGPIRFVADGVADYVRARVRDGSHIPRIPPLRLRGGLEAQADNWDLRGEVERVFAQNRVAEFENPTQGHTMVNAALTLRPWGRANPNALVLSANNIFDVEARRHASFTKDFVSLAGRDFRVSARLSF